VLGMHYLCFRVNADGEDVILVKHVLGLLADDITLRDGMLFSDGVAQKEPCLNPDVPDRVLRHGHNRAEPASPAKYSFTSGQRTGPRYSRTALE